MPLPKAGSRFLVFSCLLLILILGCLWVPAGPAFAAEPSLSADDALERMEEPAEQLNVYEKQIFELESQRDKLKEELNKAGSDPAAAKRIQELKDLEEELAQVQDDMANHRRQRYAGGPLDLAIKIIFDYYVQLLALSMVCFFLIASYLVWFKRDMAFIHDWAVMRTAFYRLVLPKPIIAKPGTGAFMRWACLIMAALFFILLVLFIVAGVASAREQASDTSLNLWAPQKLSFDEALKNLNLLAEKDQLTRFAFILEHPVRPDLRLTSYVKYERAPQKGYELKKEPGIRFQEQYLPVNSYEHLYLLGRVLYEKGDLDKSLRYFGWAKDLSEHPFHNPNQAQHYLLNQLKIVLSQKREAEYRELLKIFLENAEPQMRYQLIRFIAFEVDMDNGLRLFERTAPDKPGEAALLIKGIAKDKGAVAALPFWEAYKKEVPSDRMPVTQTVAALVEAHKACDPDDNKDLATEYLAGLKLALEQTRELAGKNHGYQYLLSLGDNKFVAQRLDADLTAIGLRSGLTSYLEAVRLLHQAGSVAETTTHLEKAYGELFTKRSDLLKIIDFCLDNDLLLQASKATDQMLEAEPGLGRLLMVEKMVKKLNLKMPVSSSGVTVLGFSGMLNYRLKNYQTARQHLEKALKPELDMSLLTYKAQPRFNMNELYSLLKTYLELKQMDLVAVALPAYERSFKEMLTEKNKEALKKKIENLKEEIKRIKESPAYVLSSDERTAQRKKKLREEIDDVKSSIRWFERGPKILSFTLPAFVILCLVWSLFFAWYTLCRASYYALQRRTMKYTVFTVVQAETLGYFLVMTLVFSSVGGLILLICNLLMRAMGVGEPKDEAVMPPAADIPPVIADPDGFQPPPPPAQVMKPGEQTA
ncbi:hypothetical protein AAU61_10520 [Desulfocarbo indianensis]|nr:hypothetical protein AAU61_10520 [Desulfocarbo indianensis]